MLRRSVLNPNPKKVERREVQIRYKHMMSKGSQEEEQQRMDHQQSTQEEERTEEGPEGGWGC